MYLFESLVFITGLIIGSFLNVCVYRVPRNISVSVPPSHCPACGHRLTFTDLFPVFSYLFTRGKCRYCSVKIPLRYPMIELFTAFLFLLIYKKYPDPAQFLAFSFLSSILIATFFVDLELSIIPDEFVITGLTGGGVFLLYNSISGNDVWWNPLLGLLTGSGFYLIIAIMSLVLLKKEGMGGGDIKIMAVIGLFLGWKLTLVTLFLSVIAGGFGSLFLLLSKIRRREDMIPFGPFIVAGTLITIFYGNQIASWYMGQLSH